MAPMRTELLQAEIAEHLARAAEHLREGRLVAFPTETVYGLGARADDGAALAELRRIKGRPRGKPFALLIAGPADLERCAAPGPAARRLAELFWPGPLTLVVPDGGGGHVGLRCPDLEAARELVRLTGAPVAAPSANPSGRPPATSAQEVLAAFDGLIAAVLDGGPARVGVASTVVRAVGEGIEVLREGTLSEAEIRQALEGEG